MSFAFRPHRRSGLTLVEILIALTMTLIVLGTMTVAFRVASQEMQKGRALIELADRARVVEDSLRTDLGSLTVETRVFDGTVEPNGYFEYIEGPVRDSTFSAGVESFQGDCDDVLCFTARSADGVLFRGRTKAIANGGGANDLVMGATTPIESSVAEIVWFATVRGNDTRVTGGVTIVDGPLDQQLNLGGSTSNVDFDDSIHIHRRILLIRPDLGTLATDLSLAEVNNFIRNIDISVRVVPGTANGRFNLIANGLNDLAVRANRFAHQPYLNDNSFPNNLLVGLLENRVASDDSENINYGAAGQTWQALRPVLVDAGAFDLRAYSPTARVNDVASIIVEPTDVGYDPNPADPADLVQRGAYVDLGYSGFTAAPTAPFDRSDEWFIASTGAINNVWDTWTPFYERDGINQDNDKDSDGVPLIDEGTNGLQNGGSNVIDDPQERETTPPYTQPIRAMKITLRLVEKGTKQVHQVSVIQSFVPE